jgi:ligand-binding sensor domain-containing protein
MVTLHRSAWQRLALLSAVIFNPLIGFGNSSGNRPGVSSPALSPSSDSLPHAIAVKEGRDIPFRRLPRSAGLSQTRVAAVAQDGVGFMWFGTQYGLNRFDGYKSKVFKHELRRADSLSCVYVRALLLDHAGRLWVGCDGYLDRYEPTTETFIHYSIDLDPSRTPSQISDIDEDRAGNLWMSTNRGLYKFDPNSSRITRYLHDFQESYSLSANLINQAHEDRMGRFWVASAGGLDEFDIREGKVKRRAPLRMPVGWSHQDGSVANREDVSGSVNGHDGRSASVVSRATLCR